MTRVAANGAVTKPKASCGIGKCNKEYASKSYLKIHQQTKHNVPHVGKEAELVNTEDDDQEDDIMTDKIDEDNSTEEALSGGTQLKLNSIEDAEINEALEAEPEVFDELGELLEGENYLVSMVCHMATAELFPKEVVSSVLDVLFDSVQKKSEEKITEPKKNDCEECAKYKEVEENQEILLQKAEKEAKVINDKIKSITGQKRSHMNSLILERLLKICKRKYPY